MLFGNQPQNSAVAKHRGDVEQLSIQSHRQSDNNQLLGLDGPRQSNQLRFARIQQLTLREQFAARIAAQAQFAKDDDIGIRERSDRRLDRMTIGRGIADTSRSRCGSNSQKA